MAAQNDVPIIDKMMAILNHLESVPEGATLTEVVRRCKIPKTTAYRILNTMRKHHLVEHSSATGRYTLGPRLFTLGNAVFRSKDLLSVSRMVLEELAGRLWETCKLTVREGDEATVVLVVESPKEMGIYTHVGRRFPLHTGAASKVILAYLPEAEQERIIRKGLARYTPRTITDPDVLRQTLAEIRARGWAEDKGEFIEGVRAYAAPVFDASGELVASVSVTFFPTDSAERLLEIRQQVVQAAQTISRALGYRTRDRLLSAANSPS